MTDAARMTVTLDACVLYPTVMREMLLGVASAGAYTPIWSARILQEWGRAAARAGQEIEATARAEIALTRHYFPKAEIAPDAALQADLRLPDADDTHVLATAILGEAKAIVTKNASDFPTRVLAQHGLLRLDPDRFLFDLMLEGHPVAEIAGHVRDRAEAASGREQPLRALLKRTGLPRLGKALG